MSEVTSEVRAALAAGWTRSDLYWERLQEEANALRLRDSLFRSAVCVLAASAIALVRFPASDLRRVTSAANVAHLLRDMGLGATSRRAYRRAYRRWIGLAEGIKEISIRPRARSSLYHLRMEALHWETYKRNTMTRMHRFMQETSECLSSLGSGQAAPHRLYERWKGEKLPIYDDTRKILAACLLVIAAHGNRNQGS